MGLLARTSASASMLSGGTGSSNQRGLNFARAARHRDRGRHIQPTMHLDHQVDIRSHGGTDRLDDLDGAVARRAIHLQIGGSERVPFQRPEPFRTASDALRAKSSARFAPENQPLP